MAKDNLPKAQNGKALTSSPTQVSSTTPLISEQLMQQEYGEYRAPNVDGSPLPNVPYVNPYAGIQSPSSQNTSALSNFLKFANTKRDPGAGGKTRTLDEYAANEKGRYDFFMPGDFDNEDAAAQGQSFGEKMVNGVGKGLWLTASTLAQSTIGLVNGAFQAINDGKFSSFYDNDLNNWLDGVSKKSEDYFPNYYTKEERDAKWYSPKYWATGNFLWDGVVKNLGFAAGAALSGAAFTQVLKAIPLTARLFATGNGAQTATATAEGVAAGTTNKVVNTLGKIRTLSDDFFGSYNAMNPGGRALVAGLATSGEAGIEALHSSNEFRQELINEHIAKYGLPPTGEALNEINAAAEGAGNSTFFANMAILSATNYIQFPRILGSTYTGEKEIINGLTREIEKDLVYEGGKLARKVSKYPFLSRLNKVRPYTFSTTEAFEEVSQYSATVATQDYYNKAKNNEATSWLDSIGVGITKGAFSNEGAKNALIGGISGRIMTAGIIPGQTQGMIQQARAKRKATDSAIKEINETSLDLAVRENVQTSDFSRETKQSLNRSSKLQEERLDSIENGEVMKSKDLEADEMINYLTARVKYGRYDLVMADLADYKTLASTEAGFDQLVKEGKALESDTREAYQERLARFEETAQNFNSLWKSLNLRYSSEYVTDNNGDPVEINGKKIRKYSASVMDKMLYAATKVSDFDSRISSTSLKLASAGINTSAVIDSIVNGDFEAYNQAVDTIKNLDVISETKDELGSTLDDMAEMVGKRQEFIKTYEEVKSNPSKFREEGIEEVIEKLAETVTIQTKTGPKDIKLNVSYVAGTAPNYNTKNIDDFLGTVTAGQIIVQSIDEKGNLNVYFPEQDLVKNMTPKAFEELKVFTLSSLRNNKMANYFYNHKNTIFTFNKGKNKGGKVPGRLEYKNGRLFFVSLGRKNKLEKKLLTRNHFVAQKDFKNALVEPSNKEIQTDTSRAAARAFLSTRDVKLEKQELQAARKDNMRVVSELIESSKETIDEISAKIKTSSEKLSKVKEDLDNIAKMQKTGEKIPLNFSKATKSFTRALNTLTQMEKDISNNILELEAQKENLEFNISYFETFLEQIYNTPEDFGEFANSLKSTIKKLNNIQRVTNKQIQSNKDVLSDIKEAIKEVGKLIREAIKSSVGVNDVDYQNINFLLNSIANGEDVLDNWPKLKEEIVNLKLTANLTKDSVIDEKKISKSLENIKNLESKIAEINKEYGTVKELLNAFQPQIKKYEAEQKQIAKLRNNKKLLKKLQSTKDTSSPIQDEGGVNLANYEAEPKKSNEILMNAGVRGDARFDEGAETLKPHEDRADKFGRNFPKMSKEKREGLRIIYVNPNTESKLGLSGLFDYLLQPAANIVDELEKRREEKKLNKLKSTALIQVIVNEEGDLVNEEGDVIDSNLTDVEKINQAIYQFMPNADTLPDKMRKENGKDQPSSVIKKLQKTYTKWRDSILEQDELGDTFAMSVSFGSIKYDSSNSTPVQDANLDLDFELGNVIFIPKLNQVVEKGSVRYKSVPGRVYLDLPNAYVPLKNRKHNKEEATAIFDALAELSKDPEIKLKKSKDILNFLKSVVYWNLTQKSTNSVFYDTNSEGDLVLTLSRKQENPEDNSSFLYNYESLQNSKEQIIDKLMNMYNNVTSEYLKDINQSYVQIKSISEEGEIESVTWPNYQTYLLSNKNADGKGSRTNPPLTTTLDKSDDNKPNRENIYFFRTEDNLKVKKDKKKKEKKESSSKNIPVDLGKGKKGKSLFKPDGKTPNKVTIPFAEGKEKVISFILIPGEITDENFNDKIKLITDKTLKSIIEKNSEVKRDAVELRIKEIIFDGIFNDVEASSEDAQAKPEDGGGKPDKRTKKRRGRGNRKNRETRIVVENQIKQVENWEKFETWLSKNFPNVPVIRVKNIIDAGGGKQAWGMFQNGAIYIYENAEIGTGYHEVFESIWAMFTDAQEKEKTLQTFRNRKGTFVDRPTGTTVKYSEATEEQAKEEVAEEFRRFMLKEKPATGFIGGMFKKLKKFIEDVILFVKTKLGLREQQNKDFIQELFKNINEGAYIDKLSTSTLPTYAQEGIVDILEVKDTRGAEFRLKINETARIDIVNEMVYSTLLEMIKTDEGLFTKFDFDAAFFEKLKKGVEETIDDHIDGFVDDIAYEEEILKNLKEEGATKKEKKTQKKEIKKASREYEKEKEKIQQVKLDIQDNWEQFIKQYKQKILAFNVQFDENNNASLLDIDKTKDSTFQDSTKRDHYREANPALRLLMATVAQKDKYVYQEYQEIAELQSSIGGVTLLPSAQVYITLMKNLSDSINIADMLKKLRNLAKNDINYRPVFKRFTGIDYSESIAEINLDNPYNSQLITALYNTFYKSNPAAKTVYALEDGEMTIGDTALSKISLQIRNNYTDSIITLTKSKKGFFTYDNKSKTYSANVKKVKGYNLKSEFDKYVKSFLDTLGVPISEEQIENIKMSNSIYTPFKEAVTALQEDIIKIKNINRLSLSTFGIGGRLLEISNIVASVSNPEYSSTFFSNGERRQTYLGVNPWTELYKLISRSKNKSDLSGTQFSYLLTDVFSEGSEILRRLYTSANNKKNNKENLLETGYLTDFTDLEKGKQKSPSSLTFRERLLSEFNLNEKGWYFNLVPGDASTEWMVYMSNIIKKTSNSSELYSIFKKYFESEVELSKQTDRPIVEIEDRKITDLRFFKGILGKTFHDKIVDFTQDEENEDLTAEDVYNKFNKKGKIDSAVARYINNLSTSYTIDLYSYGILKEDVDDNGTKLRTFSIQGSKELANVSADKIKEALFRNTANYMIANIEMHKILYSDPYQYKDELKRVKNFLSPRLSLIHNSEQFSNNVLSKIYNSGVTSKDDIAWTPFSRDYFRTVVYDDVQSLQKDLASYLPHEETDGGGIIRYLSYRWFRILASDWNANEEAQFQHDMGYERLVKSGATKEEIDEYEKGNPGVRSAYTPLKPIVAGAKNGYTYNNVVLDKYSLYPVSFRVMHKLNPESNLVKLSDKMQAEDIDYAIFKSGRKVGANETFPPYKNGKFNEDLYTGIEQVPFSIMSVQQDVPSKDKNTVPRGSQITKIVTLDFLNNGIPEDFETTETDINTRFEKWFSLSEEEKMEKSNLYKKIKKNQELLEDLISKGYDSLLIELGISDVNNEFIVSDIEKTTKILESEMFKREVNINIIQALSAFLEGRNSLESTPAYQQIRNILYSIVDKRVLRQQISGGQKVQISSVYFEGEERKVEVVKNKKGQDTNIYESTVLSFYSKGEKNKDTGKVEQTNGMEIMIGRWFDSPLSDEDLLNYLNTTDEGQKILKGVAFRIPTQAQNSIDSYRIKTFLPKEFGDSAVVPSGIVAKVGSDFDIDKLSIYFKNVRKNKDGNPEYIPFLDDNNSNQEERYVNYVRDTSDSETYRDIIKELNESSEKFETDNLIDEEFKKATEVRQEKESLKQDKEDLYISGYNIFKNLPDYIQDEYRAYEDELTLANIEGVEKNMLYKEFTNRRLKVEKNNGIRSIYNLLIGNYNEVNELYGVTEDLENKFLDLLSKAKSIKNFNVKSFRFERAKVIAEFSNIESFDQFKEKTIVQQNSKKAVENAYIESLEDIILDPYNYDRLIRPNSAEYLESLAKDVITEIGDDVFEYSKVDNMLKRGYMARLRHAFLTGKRAIGIAAKNQTLKSLLQRVPVFIDEDKISQLSDENKKFLPNLNIGFKNYNTINIPGKGEVITLSGNTEASDEEIKKLISDINGQAVDGFVDISNGPWIMQMGATPNVVSTFQFLNTIGVPIKDVVYFMNQPIIREYIKTVEKNGYSWLFIDDYVSEIKNSKKYITSSKIDIAEIPNAKTLLKTISGKDLSNKQKAQQQFYLDEFLKYAKLANQLFELSQGISWDTARINDPFLLLKKQIDLKKSRNTIFSSYDFDSKEIINATDAIINASFLKKLIPTLLDSRDVLGTILTSDKKDSMVRNVLHKVLTPYSDRSDRDFIKIAKKAVANLFDYVVQTDGVNNYGNPLNSKINETLLTFSNSPTQVMDFVNKVKADDSHPLYDNYVVNLLQISPSNKSGKVPYNLKLTNTDQKVYDQDIIISSFRQLRDFISVTPEGKNLYDKLLITTILQSGLLNSPISFTSLLPYEDFERFYGRLDRLNNISNIEQFYSESVFERNNWSDGSMVPYKKAIWIMTKKGKWKYNPAMIYIPRQLQAKIKTPKTEREAKIDSIPQLVTISNLSREAKSDFIVYSWDDPSIRKEKKQQMRKVSNFSYINKGLFKKVYREDGTPLLHEYEDKYGVLKQYNIYKQINAWGDSFRANEFYDFAKESVIDNGFLKVYNERPDEVIESLFYEGSTIASQTSEVREVAEGIKIIDNALTSSEEAEIFQMIKPFLESQGSRSNKGNAAPIMIGMGLRWDYKSNNPGKSPVEIKETIVNSQGQRNKYAYYDVSIDGEALGAIPTRLKELMTKATGIDASNYDGAIINIYPKNGFISAHNDVDESVTAINYPVIVANIGGAGSLSVEGAESQKARKGYSSKEYVNEPLSSGSAYIFGEDGKNRNVFHRTLPSSGKGNLPQLNVKGQIIPANSYRISVTLRRVKDLDSGMPISPAKVSKSRQQTSEVELGTKTAPEGGNVIIDATKGKKPQAGAVVAFRTKGKTEQNMIDALDDLVVGNPFGPDAAIKTKPDGEAVTRFLNWLEGTGDTDVMQGYRNALLDKVPELKGKTIFYYKDLGRPSHATALDYFLNKPTKEKIIEGKQLPLFETDATLRLKNGRDYKISEIDGSMLEDLGYTKKEVIEILKNNIC